MNGNTSLRLRLKVRRWINISKQYMRVLKKFLKTSRPVAGVELHRLAQEHTCRASLLCIGVLGAVADGGEHLHYLCGLQNYAH